MKSVHAMAITPLDAIGPSFCGCRKCGDRCREFAPWKAIPRQFRQSWVPFPVEQSRTGGASYSSTFRIISIIAYNLQSKTERQNWF